MLCGLPSWDSSHPEPVSRHLLSTEWSQQLCEVIPRAKPLAGRTPETAFRPKTHKAGTESAFLSFPPTPVQQPMAPHPESEHFPGFRPCQPLLESPRQPLEGHLPPPSSPAVLFQHGGQSHLLSMLRSPQGLPWGSGEGSQSLLCLKGVV